MSIFETSDSSSSLKPKSVVAKVTDHHGFVVVNKPVPCTLCHTKF